MHFIQRKYCSDDSLNSIMFDLLYCMMFDQISLMDFVLVFLYIIGIEIAFFSEGSQS